MNRISDLELLVIMLLFLTLGFVWGFGSGVDETKEVYEYEPLMRHIIEGVMP